MSHRIGRDVTGKQDAVVMASDKRFMRCQLLMYIIGHVWLCTKSSGAW